jgi:hypothetical protein
MDTVKYVSWANRQEREGDHSPNSKAEVKIDGAALPHPIRLPGVMLN